VTRAAVYVTLRRLEEKGLLRSWMSDPTAERGGKSRRCVEVTPLGLRALKDTREFLHLMWRGADLKVTGGR
jgi:DNA-binding PadR family transcriptional regulator